MLNPLEENFKEKTECFFKIYKDWKKDSGADKSGPRQGSPDRTKDCGPIYTGFRIKLVPELNKKLKETQSALNELKMKL